MASGGNRLDTSVGWTAGARTCGTVTWVWCARSPGNSFVQVSRNVGQRAVLLDPPKCVREREIEGAARELDTKRLRQDTRWT